MKEKTTSHCVLMLPSTKKRLKRLAVDLELPIGTTISYLLDHVAPITGEELVKMICENHVE